MAARESSRPKLRSRRKPVQGSSGQREVVGVKEIKRYGKYRVDHLSRIVIILGAVLVCVIGGWTIGLVSWGVAYISCGEAPITRRNELMTGMVYYKPGDRGYGLASPVFKGGYVCSDSGEYKRATPPHVR